MVTVRVEGPVTAALIVATEAAKKLPDVRIELAPQCGEEMSSELGPLPRCALPMHHKGDHSPYGF